jgi:hypothetical protein
MLFNYLLIDDLMDVFKGCKALSIYLGTLGKLTKPLTELEGSGGGKGRHGKVGAYEMDALALGCKTES